MFKAISYERSLINQSIINHLLICSLETSRQQLPTAFTIHVQLFTNHVLATLNISV